MIRTFWNQSIAAQYILDHSLPIGSIRQGSRGYNCVEDTRYGGEVVAPSDDACRGVTLSLDEGNRRVA